jgi:hypothetical protein
MESKLYWQAIYYCSPSKDNSNRREAVGRIQGGMSPWSQGEAREGEAASDSERWKGEVSSPSKESMGKVSGLTKQLA